MKVTYKFKCSGLTLEEPDSDDDNSWTIDLGPGNSIVKKFNVKEDKKKKSSGGMGMMGMGAMGGYGDLMDEVSREFKIIETKAELYEEE